MTDQYVIVVLCHVFVMLPKKTVALALSTVQICISFKVAPLGSLLYVILTQNTVFAFKVAEQQTELQDTLRHRHRQMPVYGTDMS